MATVEECQAALEKFAASIASNNEQLKSKLSFERRLACDIADLSVSFHGRFSGGSLIDLADGDDSEAEIRMVVDSDDLVALVDGELDLAKSFASGRVKVKANLMDLLKLKGMF